MILIVIYTVYIYDGEGSNPGQGLLTATKCPPCMADHLVSGLSTNLASPFHPVNTWGLGPGVCFTNVLRAPPKIMSRKIYNARNHIYDENFKLKLCTCAQSMGTCANFQLEILIKKVRVLRDINFKRIFWMARKMLVKQPPEKQRKIQVKIHVS